MGNGGSFPANEGNKMTVQYATNDFGQSPNFQAFQEAHPIVAAWLVDKRKTFDFACSLLNSVLKYGNLSEKQYAAALKCVERDQTRQINAAFAPVIDTTKLEGAFKKAIASKLKRPKLRFDGFEASLAPLNGKNAGAIYLKGQKKKTYNGPTVWGSNLPQSEDVYFGKVQGGKFFASGDCGEDQKAKIVEILADPLAAAVAYGKRYGACSCCGLTLTNPLSVEKGIGPICQKKYGL